jgi:Ni,Fe-hydrogenase III small subunit
LQDFNGGVFKDNYAILGGIQDKLPVDISIKGCPSEPIDILSGLLLAFGK